MNIHGIMMLTAIVGIPFGFLIYAMCQPSTEKLIKPQLDEYVKQFKNCKTKEDLDSLYSVIIENKDFFEKDKKGFYHIKIVARRSEIAKLMNDIKTVYAFLENKEN